MMRISQIPVEDRPALGKVVYEARLAPMTWLAAFQQALGREMIKRSDDTTALFALPRDYALRSGNPWPPAMPEGWRSNVPPRARDWLILT